MLPKNDDLSLIWVAALKSPIHVDRPLLVDFKLHGVDYLAFRPLASQTFAVAELPIEPEPNFVSSQGTFAARNPFFKREMMGFKKPDKTALEELRAALVRCYTEEVAVDRMQSVWNFELTQSVMDV